MSRGHHRTRSGSLRPPGRELAGIRTALDAAGIVGELPVREDHAQLTPAREAAVA
ncbi:hypothetical protein [Streptomyces xiaopingdaonensis]|uniref:hypothetical protein n=1 Tax=Streptomyces xiaopingdaonensis TaxID=1565415 RepID=UPI00031EB621|nr:hypothetical protein [Streptomyces xiaopingdaonensis]